MGNVSINEFQLDNGLSVIGEVNSDNKSTAIGFFVKTGSRDEMREESGVSHFLEHMMFKGTDKRTALDITFELGNIGAQANAYTSEESTVYYGSVIPEYFANMHELLSDMLRPSLIIGEFDTEKNVILEEIALYQDRPQFRLFEKAYSDFFGEHSAGNSILGTTESITALTNQQMRAYFNRRYSPENITLVATGNFGWDTFVANTEKYCGHWKRHAAERELLPFTGQEIEKVYSKKDLSQVHILYMTSGCSVQDDERYPLALLGAIMGDSTGSRIYWELVDKGLVDSAGADSDERDGTGCFTVYASTKPENLERVVEILEQIISAPMNFSTEDLERAKTKIISRMVLGGELPIGRLMALGIEWTYRKEIHRLQEQIARMKAVTKDDIKNALERFPLEKWSKFKMVSED